ncbi:synaptic vesicular amine transporter-like [Saccostrea cucullata]|uniref:synaptic vesicular amine transporter-like n=1 Tax=Saccostrea cuccullata TaxID=36930 RepID=UPI002ED66D88
MAVKEVVSLSKMSECINRCRQSRYLILVVVFIALFLDSMLLSVVVPIIPNFLRKLKSPYEYVNKTVNKTALITTCVPMNVTLHSNIQRLESTYNKRLSYAESQNRMDCVNQTMIERIQDVDEIQIKTRRHAELTNENVEVGLMFSSKALIQLIANPFIGHLTNRVGYTIPMLTGFVVMFVSTIVFAFGENYWVLVFARAVQGISSSCSSVAGMGMLAMTYPDDKERGNVMCLALGGLAMGAIVGPLFGGTIYEFAGKEAPFLILSSLALVGGLLRMFMLQPSVKPESKSGASLSELLRDPYILITAGSITFAYLGIAMMQPSLPIWMFETMGSPEWQQGAIFLPVSISFLIGLTTFGKLAHKMGRWLSSLIGLIIIGVCLIAIPFSKNIYHLIAPNFGLGFALGMVDSSMMPHMGYLVDLRHVSVYGSVYAIADFTFCLGFAFGPAISGTLVKEIGFNWMLWIIAIINLIYAPLLYWIRNPPGREEKMSLIMNDQCPVQYVTYNQTGKSLPTSDVEDPYGND